MRSKTDFYRLFFEQLARRGFDVKRSQSSDYIADIYFKSQLVAYFSKADTVIQNPFVTVKDKLIRLINDTAQNTANKAGICRDCPYTDANEKLPNGSYKLAEYNTSRSALCCSAVFTHHDTRLTRQRKSSLYGSMVAGSIVLKAKSLHLPKGAFSADFLINDLERSNLY